MPTPETELSNLLVDSFTNYQLVRFLYDDEATRPFVASLPATNIPGRQFAEAAVLLLRRQGHIEVGLFDRLAACVPPSLRTRLADVARAFGLREPVASFRDAMPPPAQVRILLMAAGPRTGAERRVGLELREIQQRLSEGRYRERFVLDEALALQPHDILATLDRKQPTILHFSGVGTPGGMLVFEGPRGEPIEIDPEILARGVKVTAEEAQAPVRLFVPNACFSALAAGVLVMRGAVPFAVGMQRAITDQAATAFSVELYRSLADGVPLQGAFDRACTQIAFVGCLGEDDIPCLVAAPGFDARAARFT